MDQEQNENIITTESRPFCWACRTLLKLNQVKCTECDSWQNWRRYLVFSSTSLALIVAILSGLATVFSLSERFLPRGVLIAIAEGNLMKNKIEFHNNEKFPVVLFGHIECDLSGKLSYFAKDSPEDHSPFDEKRWSIIHAKIKSVLSVERVVKSGEFVSVPVEFHGQGMGFETDIEFQNLENLVRSNLARIHDAGMQPLRSDEGPTIGFSPNNYKNCVTNYRTPGSEEIAVPFENRFVARDIVAAANRVFFRIGG